MTALFSEAFGAGEPTLVLLHGVGAAGSAFGPLIGKLSGWPGKIVVPDLRGHGRSPHATHYGMGHHAADVANLFAPGERLHVVGHSMGGAVALVLASGLYGVEVVKVSAFGVKDGWTRDELAKGAAFAASPVCWFDTRAAAAERFLKVSGLFGHVAVGDPAADTGIVEDNGKWRLAADNATVRAAGATCGDFVKAVRAPYQLFCGGRDPMVKVEDMRRYDPNAFAVGQCGHNPHIEAPDEVAKAILKFHLG
jgi:pimeloyl-ACP methyl ester carboxylesterase